MRRAANEPEETVMVDPHNYDCREPHHIGEIMRPLCLKTAQKRTGIGQWTAVGLQRHLYLQYEQRSSNREHAITERFYTPCLFLFLDFLNHSRAYIKPIFSIR